MKLKRILATILALVLLVPSTLTVFAANGPNSELAYICIYDSKKSVYLYDNFLGAEIGTINGATYNVNSNTLTLSNFNQPGLTVETNTMGDDFKINLVGENHIQNLSIWGDCHGGSCEFTGSGKLFVNENKFSKTAIYMSPEDTKSILKAGGSTTITAYAPAGGNSFYVNCTEYKDCIVGNASASPKAEAYTYNRSVPVISHIGEDTDSYEVYRMEGSSSLFAVVTVEYTNSSRYTIYQIVKSPDDDSYILCFYKSDSGTFDPSEYGLIDTGEVMDAKSTSYSTAEPLWKDSKGNKFVFMWEWDSETSSSYYQKYSVAEYVKSDTPYSKNGFDWHIAIPTDDNTKYANNRTAPEEAGYTCDAVAIDGLYNVSVSASPFTITAGNHTHSYKNVVTKATLSTNGKIVPTCSCGSTKAATAIAYPKTIALSASSYVYDGKVKTPTVTVKDANGKAIAASNYTVSYASGRKNVGKYAVTVTFKGNYSGAKTLYYTIVPKATTLSSVSALSKGFTAKWKKQTTQTTGYEIQYSTDKNFKKDNKTVTVSKNSTTVKKVTKLKAKKKYYVRVRTYKTVSGTKCCSAWSKAKTVTTKK